jgi:hypothetical protein
MLVLKYVVTYAVTAPPREMLARLMRQWSADERHTFEIKAEANRVQYWEPLKRTGLWADLAPSERELAETTILTLTTQQQIKASWRVEALQMFLWALGLIPQIPPYDTQASHDILKQIPTCDDAGLGASLRLRSDQDLDRARDDAVLWHWRSRTRQLIEKGKEFPATKETRAAGFRSYNDIVRFTAHKAAKAKLFPNPIDDDFPAFGKAYGALSAEQWSMVRSITMERHFALNWLAGYAPGNQWDETPTDT